MGPVLAGYLLNPLGTPCSPVPSRLINILGKQPTSHSRETSSRRVASFFGLCFDSATDTFVFFDGLTLPWSTMRLSYHARHHTFSLMRKLDDDNTYRALLKGLLASNCISWLSHHILLWANSRQFKQAIIQNSCPEVDQNAASDIEWYFGFLIRYRSIVFASVTAHSRNFLDDLF